MKLEYTPKIIKALNRGNKLEAIKIAKDFYGISLIEAKEFIEAYNGADQNSPTQAGQSSPHNASKTISKSFISEFTNNCPFSLKKESNGVDFLVHPNISESKKSIARNNFGLGMDERILLIRDTGFWNNCDQGLVLTNEGIHCIPDNEKPNEKIEFGWQYVKNVKYQELSLYFYDYDGNYCPIHISYFTKQSDENRQAQLGRQLAYLFTELAGLVAPAEDQFSINSVRLDEIIKSGDYAAAIKFANSCITSDPDMACYYYYKIACVSPDNKSALKAANQGLAKSEVGTPAYTNLAYVHMYYDNEEKDFRECRKYALEVMKYADPSWESFIEETTSSSMKQDAEDFFEQNDDEYVKTFLEQPYEKRKTLMIVDEYKDLRQNRLSVVSYNCDLSHLNFPIGHPIANQVYVGHPLIPQNYIPFENYQLELVEDKVREFCQLAQSLGALEISIECLNASSSDNNVNGTKNLSGNVSYKVAKASGSQHGEYSRHMIDELNRSISLHQTYQPHSSPCVPEGLVWYSTEPSWQRLVSQRMNGGLLSHEERIETKKSQMVEGRELSEIKGEIKYLFVDMGVSFDKTEENKYAQQENATLSIKVKFAPLTAFADERKKENLLKSCDTQEQIGNSTSEFISEEEQEYLEELKECLADGEIGPRERRLLDKIRIKLGISEDRAQKLEDSLATSPLTEDEQEYLDELKECLVDGEIGPRERRLLEKIRTKLGISEERGKEIEKLA